MNPVIVALDLPTLDEALALAERVGDAVGAVKVGYELFYAEGPRAVEAFADRKVFLDLKLHDIPTTVGRAVRALAPLGVEILNVHALGGTAMMEAANEAKATTKVIAVTILTHLDDPALKEIGLPPVHEAVPHLASLAKEAGCDGVVCAPQDIRAVRTTCGDNFLIVTPGVRPVGSSKDDQARAMTPREALDAGADRLVLGRPITHAADPRAAAEAILKELA